MHQTNCNQIYIDWHSDNEVVEDVTRLNQRGRSQVSGAAQHSPWQCATPEIDRRASPGLCSCAGSGLDLLQPQATKPNAKSDGEVSHAFATLRRVDVTREQGVVKRLDCAKFRKMNTDFLYRRTVATWRIQPMKTLIAFAHPEHASFVGALPSYAPLVVTFSRSSIRCKNVVGLMLHLTYLGVAKNSRAVAITKNVKQRDAT